MASATKQTTLIRKKKRSRQGKSRKRAQQGKGTTPKFSVHI